MINSFFIEMLNCVRFRTYLHFEVLRFSCNLGDEYGTKKKDRHPAKTQGREA